MVKTLLLVSNWININEYLGIRWTTQHTFLRIVLHMATVVSVLGVRSEGWRGKMAHLRRLQM